MHASIAFALMLIVSVFSCKPSYAEEMHPGNRYKVVRPLYLMGVYDNLNNRTLSKETAKAYLHSQRYAKKAAVAFQCEIPVGTTMTIIGDAPKVWSLPFLARRYFVRLEPDPSRGLDVIVELNGGMEGNLDGLNPDTFVRP
jgi:hypothetical protein